MNLAEAIARISKEDGLKDVFKQSLERFYDSSHPSYPDIDIDFAVVSDELLNNMRTMISRMSNDSNLIFLGDHATLPPEASEVMEVTDTFIARRYPLSSPPLLPFINELEGFRPGIAYSYDTTNGRMVDLTSIRLEDHMD